MMGAIGVIVGLLAIWGGLYYAVYGGHLVIGVLLLCGGVLVLWHAGTNLLLRGPWGI